MCDKTSFYVGPRGGWGSRQTISQQRSTLTLCFLSFDLFVIHIPLRNSDRTACCICQAGIREHCLATRKSLNSLLPNCLRHAQLRFEALRLLERAFKFATSSARFLDVPRPFSSPIKYCFKKIDAPKDVTSPTAFPAVSSCTQRPVSQIHRLTDQGVKRRHQLSVCVHLFQPSPPSVKARMNKQPLSAAIRHYQSI